MNPKPLKPYNPKQFISQSQLREEVHEATIRKLRAQSLRFHAL